MKSSTKERRLGELSSVVMWLSTHARDAKPPCFSPDNRLSVLEGRHCPWFLANCKLPTMTSDITSAMQKLRLLPGMLGRLAGGPAQSHANVTCALAGGLRGAVSLMARTRLLCLRWPHPVCRPKKLFDRPADRGQWMVG